MAEPSYQGQSRPRWKCWCNESHAFPPDTPFAVLHEDMTRHAATAHPGDPFVPTPAQLAGHRANGGTWPIPASGGTR